MIIAVTDEKYTYSIPGAQIVKTTQDAALLAERGEYVLLIGDGNKKLVEEIRKAGVPAKGIGYPGKDKAEELVRKELAYEKYVIAPAKDKVAYFDTIESVRPAFEAKTGFLCLDDEDKNLYGGIHEGLHVLGAVSGEGKSTFILQVSDQVATSGIPILFFATEQTEYELMAKSISRETYLYGEAATYAQIINGRWYERYPEAVKKAIAYARDKYRIYAGNLHFIDRNTVIRVFGQVQLSAKAVCDTTRDFCKITGKRPVVIVDYIQNLMPEQVRWTAKQNTDDTVSKLKALSVTYKIPVIAVSSFNRENYTEPVSMTSFKESGAIEYASDFLYGLQQYGMDYTDEDRESMSMRKQRIAKLRKENGEKKKNREPVAMEFKCLKQRNGMQFSEEFSFVAAYSAFYEGLPWEKTDDNPFEFDWR